MESITTNISMTIGIDLGDRHSQVCVLDASGKVSQEVRVRTTKPGITRTLAAWPGSRVVLETGTHSGWVARALESAGFEVIVAHARQVRLITHSDRKNDRNDAEQLARLGRVDPKLLRPVQVRSEELARDMTVLRTRDVMVRTRTSLINEARSLAKSLGHRLPSCSSDAFAARVRKGLEPEMSFAGLTEMLDLIEAVTLRIRALERHVEELSRSRYPQTAALRQIAGVGPITSLAFVLTVGDAHRFGSSRTVGAYFGLRPVQRDSGQRRPELGISKGGDRFVRQLLVQAAHYILGPFGPDSDLRRFGLRLAARGAKAAKKKAVVAVARKLAVILHRLWLSGEAYEPLGYRSEQVVAA